MPKKGRSASGFSDTGHCRGAWARTQPAWRASFSAQGQAQVLWELSCTIWGTASQNIHLQIQYEVSGYLFRMRKKSQQKAHFLKAHSSLNVRSTRALVEGLTEGGSLQLQPLQLL